MLGALSGLVEQSLVVAAAGADGATRYRLLEPVRDYARERLEQSGEAAEARRRHAAYYLALAERAEPALWGAEQTGWLDRLGADLDNLRAAMRWLLDRGEREDAARFGWALRWFWWLRNFEGEGLRWMEEVLDAGGALPAAARARPLCVAGMMALRLGDRERAQALLEESLTLCRAAGDREGAAQAAGSAGLALVRRGELEPAERLLEEGLRLHRELGNRSGEAQLLTLRGLIPLNRGEYEQAEEYFDRALALSRRVGNAVAIFQALYHLAVVAQAQGDYSRAAARYREALALGVAMRGAQGIAACLNGLAECAAALGQPERAARLYGAAEAAVEPAGIVFERLPLSRAFHEHYRALARDQLEEPAFEAAWAEGRAMSRAAAVAYAQESGDSHPSHG